MLAFCRATGKKAGRGEDDAAMLTEEQRRAVELRHLKGQSLAEVAAALGCSKAAVVGLLHRGVHTLREVLAEASEG